MSGQTVATTNIYFDRDLSWLSFNERVLQEAAKPGVPLLERVKFLSIYSSNLDEFYRVRIPALTALLKLSKRGAGNYEHAVATINLQQQEYGRIMNTGIIPALEAQGIHFLYNRPIPEIIAGEVADYFFSQTAGFLQPVLLSGALNFFPENNQLYQAVAVAAAGEKEQLYLVNIPVAHVGRFLRIEHATGSYIVFLEEIIRQHLDFLFPNAVINGAWNIKITRDAELDLQDEYDDDLAEKIERQLTKRDYGFATRFLYEPGIPLRHLQVLIQQFNLTRASVVEGSKHHNLRDLDTLPVGNSAWSYEKWPAAPVPVPYDSTLFEYITARDMIVHAPYQLYDNILRFFNEAAVTPSVTEVYTTLYRVASDSRIAQALISAARNGKKVTVLVELKARFDEANNIRWAKKMKAAGVKIIYSNNSLKVHAKIALVKRAHATHSYVGLLATGNLNESTARFYTDHILLTAHQPMLQEMQQLFGFLSKSKKRPDAEDELTFRHLLVAQFNLQTRFLELIDREIMHAQQGSPASITIKMNNLEERVLIDKLYEASQAGVRIQLIVRSICRLIPGVAGQSEHITIVRIVDRYLEHGRVFEFYNNGATELYLGSADWMNRNIYRRIEVCFPVYDEGIRLQLRQLLTLQLQDNKQAVHIDRELRNVPVAAGGPQVRSQQAIYELLVAGEHQHSNL
ncbi:polyphosphate kinase 1 [Filimonas effusa]|uniref:Polyphosphate kinase n=1 Tax=Filimonas effusa TaxID=2508721 RepID=A0A4Q1DBB4_9BACT|nr:polyphosphate kinase 1 [Filimonas effusa]RXK85863.1 polyphosphate kinase 1 [Filimonas effusa]